jgi:4-hydroxy-tetrahydrodipicolinate reductase
MNIALIGYGAMGKLIEQVAADRGHRKVVVVHESHAGLDAEQLAETLKIADVAIDFSSAEAVRRNVEACMLAKVPIIEGTTGWNADKEEVLSIVTGAGGAMVYAANFSIGVNLFYRIAEHAAELFAKFPEYETFIEEQHHSRKKDSPSGTALRLQEIVSAKLTPKDADEGVRVEIAATRAGNIPGTHRVGFDGPAEQILLEHTARSRDCFALGALKAAEWVEGKAGTFEFGYVVDEIISGRK